MSNHVGGKIEALWPTVKWKGGSPIHRSIAKQVVIPSEGHTSASFSKAILDSKMGEALLKRFSSLFKGCNFLVSAEDITQLIAVDAYCHLSGVNPKTSGPYIVNPKTANVFGVVASYPPKGLVGGLRAWAYSEEGSPHIIFGFRFRWAGSEETETDLARQAAEYVAGNVLAETVINEQVEISEPPQRRQISRRHLKEIEDY